MHTRTHTRTRTQNKRSCIFYPVNDGWFSFTRKMRVILVWIQTILKKLAYVRSNSGKNSPWVIFLSRDRTHRENSPPPPHITVGARNKLFYLTKIKKGGGIIVQKIYFRENTTNLLISTIEHLRQYFPQYLRNKKLPLFELTNTENCMREKENLMIYSVNVVLLYFIQSTYWKFKSSI